MLKISVDAYDKRFFGMRRAVVMFVCLCESFTMCGCGVEVRDKQVVFCVCDTIFVYVNPECVGVKSPPRDAHGQIAGRVVHRLWYSWVPVCPPPGYRANSRAHVTRVCPGPRYTLDPGETETRGTSSPG